MYSIMERRFFSCIDKIGINNYLTIIPLEDGLQAKLSDNECEYCIDGNGYWKVLPAGEFTETVNAGHTLSFRGNLTPKSDIGVGTFTVNKYFNLKGNCMSMLFGDEAKNSFSLSNKHYTFKNLFYNSDKLINAKGLVLQATTLSAYCYFQMFKGCTNLTNAPILPAIKLINFCYMEMFYGCTSLTEAPELPAMLLSGDCYRAMFTDCISLNKAPELPATTLVDRCYYGMFGGCTSLRKAPVISATALANSCCCYMFSRCSSLVEVPELLATKLAISCYAGMFQNCTSLTKAPVISAITLANNCCQRMFDGCTSLEIAPELNALTLTTLCYEYMFHNCNKLNYIKMMATDITANSCLLHWVLNVGVNGTFVKNKDATWENGIVVPSGWEVITE